MEKIIFLALIFITIISCEEKDVGLKTKYFSNGKIMEEIQINKKNIPNGLYKKYYESGVLEEKGMFSEGKKTGWWVYFDSLGIKNEEKEFWYSKVKSKTFENQKILYDQLGNILYERSNFFKINLNDTIFLGRNIGTVVCFSEHLNKDYLSSVVVQNRYVENKIKMDTFVGDIKNKPMIGVLANKTGNKLIKGFILERVFSEKNNDSLIITHYRRYFEKKVFVKDTVGLDDLDMQ